MKTTFVFSCEHAGNVVPPKFKSLFKGRGWLLKTHRGYDPGANQIALCLSKAFEKALIFHPYTRLLIDVNRDLNQETLFSIVTANIDNSIKKQIVDQYYTPYKLKLQKHIQKQVLQGRVLHISIHSFTPVMKNQRRDCDIGLLFKQSDVFAKKRCLQIQKKLLELNPKLRVKLNYPYDAEHGGIMNAIRSDLPIASQKRYSGIYIECNQRLAKLKSQELASLLAQSLS